MATFYDRWSHAKGDFEKSKALFPAAMLAKLNKGAGLGPALKTLDKADGYESKAKALMAVRTAKEWYDRELRSARNTIPKKDSAAFKALDRLEKTLQTSGWTPTKARRSRGRAAAPRRTKWSADSTSPTASSRNIWT